MPMPFGCAGLVVVLLNEPLETGRGGALRATEYPPSGSAIEPWASASTGAGPAPRMCSQAVHTEGGTWRVLQGGSWGDVVELEIRDARFSALGQVLVIESLVMRARILEPVIYP